jgi:hypothetical protein
MGAATAAAAIHHGNGYKNDTRQKPKRCEINLPLPINGTPNPQSAIRN